MAVTGNPLVELGITTTPLVPVYLVMVIVPLLLVKVNCASSVSGPKNASTVNNHTTQANGGLLKLFILTHYFSANKQWAQPHPDGAAQG
jgi:hypothetical protein